MTWYLTLRPRDGAPVTGAEAETAVEAQPGVRRGPHGLEAEGVRFVLARLSGGGYVSDGSTPATVDVVELLCSDAADPEACEALAARVAGALGWAVEG